MKYKGQYERLNLPAYMKFGIEIEANNILALIYRDYWATEEEKEEFRKKDEEERKLNEEKLEHIFDRKDNEQIEEEKNNQLIKIEHESFIKRFFCKN